MSCLSFKVEIHFPNANVSENVDSFPDNGLQVQIQIVFLKLLRSYLVMILMNQKRILEPDITCFSTLMSKNVKFLIMIT